MLGLLTLFLSLCQSFSIHEIGQSGKTCQMYGMLVLACVQSAVKGDREHFFQGLLLSLWPDHSLQLTLYITAPSHWSRLFLQPTSCPGRAPPNPHNLNPIVSIFHTLLFPLLWPCCWQKGLYKLVATLWLTYFVSVLFCVMTSWEPTLGPRLACQPLYICRFSWEELSAFERFSS